MASQDSERVVVIQPAESQDYEGRQWGWDIYVNGELLWNVTTGGTGPCWNIVEADVPEDERFYLHVCDLDDLIAALTALRDSDEHRANVARWER